MKKTTIIMKAPSAHGFGDGQDFYVETIKIVDSASTLRQALVNFALKYNVTIDSITLTKLN